MSAFFIGDRNSTNPINIWIIAFGISIQRCFAGSNVFTCTHDGQPDIKFAQVMFPAQYIFQAFIIVHLKLCLSHARFHLSNATAKFYIISIYIHPV